MAQRDGGSRNGLAASAHSLPALGYSLRRARVSKGLAVSDAARAAGVSIDDIVALEAGIPGHLPDQVHTVNLLRRYAQALGLDADRYALTLLDAWPLDDPSHQANAAALQDAPTGTVPPASPQDTGVLPANRREQTGVLTAMPASPYAPGDTGRVPIIPSPADTGPTPTVAPGSPHRSHSGRGGGGIVLLRVLVVLLLLLVVAAGAVLAIHHWRPQWLRSIEKNVSGSGSTNSGSSSGGSHRSGVSTSPSISGAEDSSSTTATVTVRGSNPQVRLSVDGGPSWVEVRDAGNSTPVFAQVMQGSDQQTFPVHSSLSVQVGSSASRMTVTAGKGASRQFTPSLAPFTYTVQQG